MTCKTIYNLRRRNLAVFQLVGVCTTPPSWFLLVSLFWYSNDKIFGLRISFRIIDLWPYTVSRSKEGLPISFRLIEQLDSDSEEIDTVAPRQYKYRIYTNWLSTLRNRLLLRQKLSETLTFFTLTRLFYEIAKTFTKYFPFSCDFLVSIWRCGACGKIEAEN